MATLTGENSFAVARLLKDMVDSFVAENGKLTLERIEGDDVEFPNIQRALSSLPFLASRQLVVLRDASKNKQFLENFEQLLDSVPDSTDVIVVESKIDKRTSLYKYLKNKTDYHEFPELDDKALSQWIIDSVKDRGGSISFVDTQYLIDRVGAQQQLLAHELDKLLLYDTHITRDVIDQLTDAVPQSTVFQLLEAAFAGKREATLNLYDEQRYLKVDPQQLIAMLTWQLHVLAILKTSGDRTSDQIAREAKINPYVIRKSQTIVQRLTLEKIRKLIADLASLDVTLKQTPIDANEALQNYLLAMTI